MQKTHGLDLAYARPVLAALGAMSNKELELLPKEIANKSISPREVVLPFE